MKPNNQIWYIKIYFACLPMPRCGAHSSPTNTLAIHSNQTEMDLDQESREVVKRKRRGKKKYARPFTHNPYKHEILLLRYLFFHQTKKKFSTRNEVFMPPSFTQTSK